MRSYLGITATVLVVTGCATQGTSNFNYVPPAAQLVKNEKTLTRRQAAVWDELVRELSKSFYVINNIERESRIINVSFSSNSPNDYVDCGRTTRTYVEGNTVETSNYAVAEASAFRVAGQKQDHPAFKTYARIGRQTSLEGRSNIYVAPDPSRADLTVVSVNTRYVLTIRVRREAIREHANGNIVARQSLPEESTSYIFNTNKPSTTAAADSAVSITCAGRGRLESDILEMVR